MVEAFSLEKALKAISERITPEQRAEVEERSNQIRGRIAEDMSSPEARAQRAKRLEPAVLEKITRLVEEPESELRTSRLNNALDRLGELRAQQGDYIGAAGVTHDEKRKAYYEKIQQAIDRDDEEECGCPTVQVSDGQSIATLSPRFKTQAIMTAKGPRDLILCATCGLMNAK